jgi:hypothetical protein
MPRKASFPLSFSHDNHDTTTYPEKRSAGSFLSRISEPEKPRRQSRHAEKRGVERVCAAFARPPNARFSWLNAPFIIALPQQQETCGRLIFDCIERRSHTIARLLLETLTITHDQQTKHNTPHATMGAATILVHTQRRISRCIWWILLDLFDLIWFPCSLLGFTSSSSSSSSALLGCSIRSCLFFWTLRFGQHVLPLWRHNTRFQFADRVALGINVSLPSGAIHPHHIFSYHILKSL